MLRIIGLLALVTTLFAGCGPATTPGTTSGGPARQTRVWNFAATAPGELPQGFEVASGTWQVVEAEDARVGTQVLIQDAKSAKPDFNVVLTDATFGDFSLGLSVKALDGEIDRGGGPVWRAIDGDNYYVARYNPLEDNFRLYAVEGGVRTELASADVVISREKWHNISIRMKGEHIECFVDGQLLLDAHDGTFAEPGRIGLWTKADARTAFDGLTVGGPPEEGER